MSIIKHVTLQKIVAHDFRYDPRIKDIKNNYAYLFMFLWAVQLAVIGIKRLAPTLFPSLSFRPLSLYSFSEQSYRTGRRSVSEINTSQPYTSLNATTEANALALNSVGFTYRKRGDSPPMQAHPYISVCFICTCNRQATIVSPLKWHMLRSFHRHD